MRKHVLMLSLMTIFILSCSQNDEKTTLEPVNGVFTKSSFNKQIEELTTNAEFKNIISKRFNSTNLKSGKQSNNQGNGAFLVQNSLGWLWVVFADGKMIYIWASEREPLTILPNGSAHFQYKSKGPTCKIFDEENFNTLYSNESYDVKTGDFVSNFISTYWKLELGPFTLYFPEQLQSSSVLKMNTTVNNSFPIEDENFNWIGWTDATVEKNVSIKTVEVGNSNANPVLQLDIK